MRGHGVHRVDVLDDALPQDRPLEMGEDAGFGAAQHGCVERALARRDLGLPDGMALLGQHHRRDDLFQALGTQRHGLHPVTDHVDVGLGQPFARIRSEGDLVAGAHKRQRGAACADLAHLGEPPEDVHADLAAIQDVTELIGDDDQPAVALLERRIAEKVLQDEHQVVRVVSEVRIHRRAVELLEDAEGLGLEVPQVLL